MNNNSRPIKKFRAGGVTAAVWSNPIVGEEGVEGQFMTVTLDRRYKDRDGNWQSLGLLSTYDIPKAVLVLKKAYDYIVAEKFEPVAA